MNKTFRRGYKLMKWRSFAQARKFARSLGFNKRGEWHAYCKLPSKLPNDIPARPDYTYKDKGWNSWDDFLGYAPKAKRKLRSFTEARKFAQSLKMKSSAEWKAYAKSGKLPNDIPRAPWTVYKNEWKSMADWLGNSNVASQKKKYLTYKEARKFVRKLKLKNNNEWLNYVKKQKKVLDKLGIPTNPNNTYKNKGWTTWGDWLGTGNISARIKAQNYLPWKEAKPIYRKLGGKYGLNNRADWKKFSKTHKKLLNGLRLPLEPWQTYTLERVWRKMK